MEPELKTAPMLLLYAREGLFGANVTSRSVYNIHVTEGGYAKQCLHMRAVSGRHQSALSPAFENKMLPHLLRLFLFIVSSLLCFCLYEYLYAQVCLSPSSAG